MITESYWSAEFDVRPEPETFLARLAPAGYALAWLLMIAVAAVIEHFKKTR